MDEQSHRLGIKKNEYYGKAETDFKQYWVKEVLSVRNAFFWPKSATIPLS